jgi:protein-tyrosine-phosphatase
MSNPRNPSKTVLFLCPHNAAKSVIAAAYFRRLAAEAGLDLVADSAGTEPDDAVWPPVIELLNSDGVETDNRPPRHVSAQDLAHAHLVVSLGCDLPDEARLAHRVEHWDDVPLPSQDLLRSRDAIKAKVHALVAQLQTASATEPKPS